MSAPTEHPAPVVRTPIDPNEPNLMTDLREFAAGTRCFAEVNISAAHREDVRELVEWIDSLGPARSVKPSSPAPLASGDEIAQRVGDDESEAEASPLEMTEREHRLRDAIAEAWDRGFVWNQFDVADLQFLVERFDAVEAQLRSEGPDAATGEPVAWRSRRIGTTLWTITTDAQAIADLSRERWEIEPLYLASPARGDEDTGRLRDTLLEVVDHMLATGGSGNASYEFGWSTACAILREHLTGEHLDGTSAATQNAHRLAAVAARAERCVEKPKHVCGSHGFNLELGDTCEACDAAARSVAPSPTAPSGEPPKGPEHRCGVRGFNPERGDSCAACDARAAAAPGAGGRDHA